MTISPVDMQTLQNALSPALLSMVAAEREEGIYTSIVAILLMAAGFACIIQGFYRYSLEDYASEAIGFVWVIGGIIMALLGAVFLLIGLDQALFPALNLFQSVLSH
jgi:hypothetical protein